MVKALSALLVSFVLCAVCGAFLVMNESWNARAAESARQSRIELQHVEQNIGLLRKASSEDTLTSLSRDQDSLKVSLALKLSDLSARNRSLNLTFQQTQVSAFTVPDHRLEVSILSLKVGFAAHHAPSAMETLITVSEAVGIWPHEFRACEIFRSQDKTLSVNCMLHIYHWPAGNSAVSS